MCQLKGHFMQTHFYEYKTKGRTCSGRCVIIGETENTVTIKPSCAKQVTVMKSAIKLETIFK